MADPDHLIEKTLHVEHLYKGTSLGFALHRVELPNGKQVTREVVSHPGAVAILAITDDDHILFVRQFRKAAEHIFLEVPAGKLQPGEDPLSCAQRELEEETGYRADRWESLSTFFVSPSFTNEVIYAYMAHGLTRTKQQLDEDEFLDVLRLPVASLRAMFQAGEFQDAKTMLCICHFLLENLENGI